MESVLSSVAWRFLSWLPGLLLRRFFSKDWLASHIAIDIRPRHNPVEISQPDSPCVRIYLQVRNNTHFEVVIDRLVLKFVYGGELANVIHLKREIFKPNEDREVFLKGQIDESRIKSLSFHHNNNPDHCGLEILAECDSKISKFTIEKYLEGIKPKVQNEHLLTSANNALNSQATPAGTPKSGAH